MLRRSASWRGVLFGAALSLAYPALAQQTPAASAAPATASPAGTARIWFYRDYEPYGSRNYAPVALNGVSAGYVDPHGGAFFRDVAPGRYRITITGGGTDVNQDKTVDLSPGQETFVKILAAPMWEMNGDEAMSHSDTFYVSLVPPDVARAQLARLPGTGRGG